jgi:hypothetical protein
MVYRPQWISHLIERRLSKEYSLEEIAAARFCRRA